MPHCPRCRINVPHDGNFCPQCGSVTELTNQDNTPLAGDQAQRPLEDWAIYVASQLNDGADKDIIARELVESGFDSAAAITIVDAVEDVRRGVLRQGALKRGVIGLLIFGVGAAITVGTWFTAEPGGTYFITYGALLVGGAYLVWGLFDLLRFSRNSGTAVGWLLAIATVFAIIGGGLYLSNNSPPISSFGSDSATEAPSDSSLRWTENDVRFTGLNTATFSGMVSNLDNQWAVEAARVYIRVYDGSERLMMSFDATISPSVIGPHETGTYSVTERVTPLAETYETEIIWNWALP